MQARVLAAGLMGAAAAFVFGQSSEVRACGTGYWCAVYAAPPAGATVPQNAPALVQYALSNNAPGNLQAPAELRGPDGEMVATRVDPDPAAGSERLLIPLAPLKSGRHVLTHGAVCRPGGISHEFTVGPAAPLPATIGTVRLEPLPVETLQAQWVNGCGWTARVSSVRIVLDPSPELAAYLSLARFTLTVNGLPWGTSAYGSDRVATPDHPGSISVLRPYTHCDPRFGASADNGPAGGGSVASGSIPPGRHRAELSVHIAGAPTDPPPVAFDLVTTCGGEPDGRPGPPDAGSDAATGPPVRPEGGGGCAFAGVSGPGRTGWVAAAALCAILRRRRRARR